MIGNTRKYLTWILAAAIVVAVVVCWLWIGPQTTPADEADSAQSRVDRQPSETSQPPRSRLQPESKALEKWDESPELLARVAVEVRKCRDLLNAIELTKIEFVSEIENYHVIRLHPPTKEELDPVYAALTKSGDSFPSGSQAATKFYDEATALIHEYAIYENPGRLLLLDQRRNPAPEKLQVIEFTDAGAKVSIGVEGQIEINSDSIQFHNKLDWNIPNSPTRLRYQHLFENP